MAGGRLRVGPSASAGAIGQVPVGAGGTLAGIASGEALVRALRPLHGDDLDLDRLVTLARDGDAAARRAIADAGEQLGAVVASLCTALNPDAVILGGVLAGDDLPLADRVRERLATPKLRDTGPVALHRAVLGPDAAALGAASAAARAVAPRPPA
jgi:predicted NBD/HSP70 family sugar kinase